MLLLGLADNCAEGQPHTPVSPHILWLTYNRRYAVCTGDIPGTSGSGDQKVSAAAPQEYLLHKNFPSKPGDITNIPNTEKQTHRVRQNEKTREYVMNERTRHGIRKRT